ncbi:MAG: hypothetical protein ACI4T6_11015, partial [Candidatus Flemingiibacterium sp.]
MAGDSNYDLWLSYDIETLGAIEYLLPWEEIPYVNLDKEWWNPMATEVFQLGGKTYAAAGNYSLSVLSRASGFVFNKDIFADVNPGVDIYALAKDGKWTIDRLYDFAKDAYSDLNGDTMMDENAINKILKIANLFSDRQVYYNTGTVMDAVTGDGFTEEDFSNGKTLFFVANMLSLEQMRSYDIDIGFLPCPKYDEEQE